MGKKPLTRVVNLNNIITTFYALVTCLALPGCPSSVAQISLPWDLLKRGKELLLTGQAGAALPFIERFIAAKPNEPEGYFWQALSLDQLGTYSLSLEPYLKSLKQAALVGMDSAEIRVNVGNTYLKMEKLDNAIVSYRRAIEIDPQLAIAYLNLARALIAKREYQEALTYLDHSSKLNLHNQQLFYYRAMAFKQCGKIDEARQQIRTLLHELPEGATKEQIKHEFQAEFP